jgi:hypothetical protein
MCKLKRNEAVRRMCSVAQTDALLAAAEDPCYAVVLMFCPRWGGKFWLIGEGKAAINVAAFDAEMSIAFFSTAMPISWPVRVSAILVAKCAIPVISMIFPRRLSVSLSACSSESLAILAH